MSQVAVRCLVGLGNPGPQYAEHRHNVGFWFAEALARQYSAEFRADAKFFGEVARIRTAAGECWLLKPTTFMNHSGRSVGALMRFYRLQPEELLVVHDELDLSPGVLRLKKSGGHGGHNGLRDIASALASKDFLRARVGIGHPGHKSAVSNYVLSRPPQSEQQVIEVALEDLLRHWETVQCGDLAAAMQVLHSARD